MDKYIYVPPEGSQEEGTFILFLKMTNTWLPEHV